MNSGMTKEQATEFFAELFCGEHHIPSEIKEFGVGWSVTTESHRFATFDFDALTRLVFLAHDRCVRAQIDQGGPRRIKITIWQRYQRDGSMMMRHPTLQDATETWRRSHPRDAERQFSLTQEVNRE